jgi:hypothetical protein
MQYQLVTARSATEATYGLQLQLSVKASALPNMVKYEVVFKCRVRYINVAVASAADFVRAVHPPARVDEHINVVAGMWRKRHGRKVGRA